MSNQDFRPFSIVVDQQLMVIDVINPDVNSLLGNYTVRELRNSNIRNLPLRIPECNHAAVEQIIAYLERAKQERQNQFFDYSCVGRHGNRNTVMCYIEYTEAQLLYFHTIGINGQFFSQEQKILLSSINHTAYGCYIRPIVPERKQPWGNILMAHFYEDHHFEQSPLWDAEEDLRVDGLVLEGNGHYEGDRLQLNALGEVVRTFHCVKQRYINPQGEVYISTMLRDVTELRREANTAKQLKEMMRVFYNQMQLGVSFYDERERLVDINPFLLKIHKIDDKSKFLNQGITLTRNPFLNEKHLERLRNGKPVKKQVSCNFGEMNCPFCQHIKRKGPIHLNMQFLPIYAEHNRLIGYMGIFEDLTEEHQRVKEEVKMRETLSTVMQASEIMIFEYDCDRDEVTIMHGNNEKLVYDSAEILAHADHAFGSAIHELPHLMRSRQNKPYTGFLRYHSATDPTKQVWDYGTVEVRPYGFDKEGRVNQYLGYIRKDTEWYQLNQQTKMANALLQEVIDRIPAGIFLKDLSNEHRYLVVNDQFASWTEMRPKELVGSNDFDLFDRALAEKFYEENSHVATRRFQVIEDARTLTESDVMLETSKYVFEYEDGRNLLMGISFDVTERKRMMTDLFHAKEQAEQSDKLKSAFIANMSHEIRTPLNAIVGFSDLIVHAQTEEEKKIYSQLVQTNNDLLLRLIDDILELSKIESGALHVQPVGFCWREFFAQTTESLCQQRKNSEVSFQVEIQPEQAWVEIDKQRVAQVLSNFISNAIKYTQQGHIRVQYELLESGVRIQVSDTGEGIPEKFHARVFGRFEKFNSFVQGVGLGLSISKAIVEGMGGEIGFSSEEGVGSTFWATFPCHVEKR